MEPNSTPTPSEGGSIASYPVLTETQEETPANDFSKGFSTIVQSLDVINELSQIATNQLPQPQLTNILVENQNQEAVRSSGMDQCPDNLVLVCELHHFECQNRYLCTQCIKFNKKHFAEHQPMISIDQINHYLNISSHDSLTEIDNTISNLLAKLYDDLPMCIANNFQSQIESSSNLLNLITTTNQRQKNSLINIYSNMTKQVEEKAVFQYQHQKPNYYQEINEFVQKVAKKNKEKELIETYLYQVKLGYSTINFEGKNQEQNYIQTLRRIVQRTLENTINGQSNIPQYNLKINNYQSLLDIDLHYNVKFNTHLFLNLSSFRQKQRKQTLETLNLYPIPFLSLKLSSKKDIFFFSINKSIKYLSLNMSSCKENLLDMELQKLLQTSSMPFNLMEQKSVELNELIINLCLNSLNHRNIQYLINILNKIKDTKSLTLDLHLNNLELQDIETVIGMIKNYKSLEFFSMSLNGFGYYKSDMTNSQNVFKHLAEAINLKKLTLNLSQTELRDSSLNSIQRMLCSLNKLENLDLDISSNDNISDHSVLGLIEKFHHFVGLKSFKLNLDNLRISQQNAQKISELVGSMDSLEQLFISAQHTNNVFRLIKFNQSNPRRQSSVYRQTKKSTFSRVIPSPLHHILATNKGASCMKPEVFSDNQLNKLAHLHIDQENLPDQHCFPLMSDEKKEQERKCDTN